MIKIFFFFFSYILRQVCNRGRISTGRSYCERTDFPISNLRTVFLSTFSRFIGALRSEHSFPRAYITYISSSVPKYSAHIILLISTGRWVSAQLFCPCTLFLPTSAGMHPCPSWAKVKARFLFFTLGSVASSFNRFFSRLLRKKSVFLHTSYTNQQGSIE